MGYLEKLLTNQANGLAVMRLLRLLRILKLTKSLPKLRAIINALLEGFGSVSLISQQQYNIKLEMFHEL